MSHGITLRDNMFTVRKPAWHNLVEPLPDYPTREEAQAIAHPWEPITEPVYRKVPQVGEDGELVEAYEEVEGFEAAVRSDDGTTLGVKPTTLPTIKNSEMYDIAEAIEGIDKGSVRYETGGSLYGGRKVWLLLALAEPITVNGDPNGAVLPYFAMQDSKDGRGGAFRGQATLTRIVCDNTAQMADFDAQARGTEFTFRHTKNVQERIEEAKTVLAGWRESIETFQRFSAHMMDLRVTPDQRELFIEQFVPMPPPHTISNRVVNNVDEARNQLRQLLAGPTCEDINGTAYGLVAASVEYLNHYRKARSAESRFKRSYLDRSRITTDAVALAQEVALA
jgi:phage/plasmid-like protein (TIGR03299 family)